jgi:hypothetical protein
MYFLLVAAVVLAVLAHLGTPRAVVPVLVM